MESILQYTSCFTFSLFLSFYAYSILLWRFWDNFSFFLFEPPPFSPLADVFLRSLTLLNLLTFFQLIISTKKLGVLCYFRIWFFNSDHLFLYIRYYSSISLSFILILIHLFQSQLVYFHILIYMTTYNQPTNRLFRQKAFL